MNMWNLIWTVIIIYNKFAIAGAIPGPVQNIKLESEFPDKRFRVSFNKPKTGNSDTFIKYRISVQSEFSATPKQCIIRWIVVCDGCTGTVGSIDSSIKSCLAVTKNNAATYKSTNRSLSFTFNNEEIEPFQEYAVFIEAANTDGWGVERHRFILIGPYKSSKVRNLITSYNSINDTLNINWMIPKHQNGVVQQYQMWIVDASSNKCLLRRKITCGNCMSLEIGNKDAQDLSRRCYNIDDDLKYNQEQNNFEITVADYYKKIEQLGFCYKDLSLNAVALNNYGWGNVTNMSCCRKLDVTIIQTDTISEIIFALMKATGCEVNQYNLWVTLDSGRCIWWTQFVSRDFSSNMVCMQNSDLSKCPNPMTTYFSRDSYLILMEAKYRLPNGSIVHIAPVTSVGWCSATETIITSKSATLPSSISCGYILIGVFLKWLLL